MAHTCFHCHAPLAPAAAFCNQCGARVDQDRTLVQERPAQPMPPRDASADYKPHSWLDDTSPRAEQLAEQRRQPPAPPADFTSPPRPAQPVRYAPESHAEMLPRAPLRQPASPPESRKCPFCAEMIRVEAIKCRYCNEIVDPARRYSPAMSYAPPYPPQHYQPPQQWNAGVAALLSFLIPGVGQMYKGNVAHGVVWFVVTLIGYMMLIVPGLVLHLICICTAASGDTTRRGG